MIINNKWGQVAVVAFIALMGFLFVRRVKELDREGMLVTFDRSLTR